VTHYLIVTADPEDPQERDFYDYEVECPGVTDECRRWEQCVASTCTVAREYQFDAREALGHGEHHRYINGMWMTPTEHCYVQGHDGLPDAVAGYFELGRHPIGWDVGDGTEIEVYPIRESVSAG
jgi:hypothetical protein